MTGMKTKWGADTIQVGAQNWGNASDQVFVLGEDGWQATEFQVADFRHSDTAALRHFVEQAASYEGEIDEEIDAAMTFATAFEE